VVFSAAPAPWLLFVSLLVGGLAELPGVWSVPGRALYLGARHLGRAPLLGFGRARHCRHTET